MEAGLLKQTELAFLGSGIAYGFEKDFGLTQDDFLEKDHYRLYKLILGFERKKREALLQAPTSKEDREILFYNYIKGKVSSKELKKFENLILKSLVDAVVPSTAVQLAKLIKKESLKRKFKNLTQQVQNEENIEDAITQLKKLSEEIEKINTESKLKQLDIEKLITSEPPKINYVFNHLPEATVGMLASPGGLGKSMFVLEVLTAVATGMDITEGAVKVSTPSECAYICLEDPEYIVHRRIRNLISFIPAEKRQLLIENLSIFTNRQIFELVDSNGYINYSNMHQLEEIAKGKRLVVIDTLRRVHSANENAAGQMSTLLQVFEVIAKTTKCSFLLIHHTGKSSEAKSRGSSVLYDNIRYQLNLEPVSKKEAQNLGVAEPSRLVKLVNTKSNYGPIEKEQLLYRLEHGVLRLYDIETAVSF